MSIINVLDKNTINQIAAGEVIERPASVVKELIENSIDAGATSVSCEIQGGGIDLIRITDNGAGFEDDDIRTAFLRHATSKIKTAADLESVMSLGFRGEALASIAAVARVELVTKRKGAMMGTRYIIEGGEEKAFENIGCPEGTTFIIRDLFSNVPVRRKFLKSATTEGSYVSDLVEKISLSHPEVSIKYIVNGKTVSFTSGTGALKDNIYSLYGREIANSLCEVDYFNKVEGISVKGFVAKPIVARSNRNLEHYFVNGRYIRNNVISKAIEEAFSSFLMQHKYPFTVLHITVPSQIMDVNVHPTKQEVRFSNPDRIFNVIYEAVFDTLKNTLLVPKAIVAERTEEKPKNIVLPNSKPYPEPFESKRSEEIKTSFVADAPITKKIDKAAEEKPEPVVRTNAEGTVNNAEKTDTEALAEKKSAKASMDMEERTTKANDIVSQNSYVQMVMDTSVTGETPVIRDETKDEFKKGLNDGYKIIGQVFNTYWMVEKGKDLYIIDQHAAHEKIIYERLVRENNDLKAMSQLISPPVIMSFSAAECEIIERHKEELSNMGFVIEEFGGREYSVSAVPLQTYSLDMTQLLDEVITSFTETDARALNQTITLKERLATCSCKAAVKGNTRLSFEEVKALIEELLKLDNPFNCPHGRPVIISMTQTELEKKFKRII